jgi:hypothetical protein
MDLAARLARALRGALILAPTVLCAACGGGGGGSSPPAGSASTVTVSGTVTFDLVPAVAGLGLDYDNAVVSPVRGVSVELVQNSAVAASAVTDAAGRFSFSAPANANVLVRARAELLLTGGPSWDFRVVDNTNGDALYVLEGTTFNTAAADSTRDLHAGSGWGGSSYTATRSAAPFAILDVIYDAVQLVLSADADAAFAPLVVHWSPSNVPTSGADGGPDPATGEIGTSFFAPGLGIYLLGAEDIDTEEYDRHVIAHEWGHYFEEVFSRSDSVGGPHTRGDQLDMRVAFGEGWGNALSAMITGDSVYRDVQGPQQSMAFGFDVEGPLPFGQSNPSPGWYSEESMQELLYDLYDANVDLAGNPPVPDQIELGFQPIFDVLTSGQQASAALTSVFPFIHALKADLPAQTAAIDQLVAAQSIAAIDDPHGTGRTNLGDPPSSDFTEVYTDIVVNAPAVNICSLNRFASQTTGAVNKLGSRRFLTFTAPAGTHTFTATATDIPVEPPADPAEPPTDPATVQADPDLVLHRAGAIDGSNGAPTEDCSAAAPAECVESFSRALSAGDYVLEVYEWTNTTSNPNFEPLGRTCFDVRVTQP